MLASAVRSDRARENDFRRRSSSGPAHSRSSMTGQVGIIRSSVENSCSSVHDDSDSDSSGDETASEPLDATACTSVKEDVVNTSKPSIRFPKILPDSDNMLINAPQRRRGSFGLCGRYSIARVLKSRRDLEHSESDTVRDSSLTPRPGVEKKAARFQTLPHRFDTFLGSGRPPDILSLKTPTKLNITVFVNVKVGSPWYILLPHNKCRMVWDVFMAWLLAFMAFYIPYRVCLYWEDETESSSIFWFEFATNVAFAIDIVLNFVTAYKDQRTKEIITAPKLIAKKYLKGFFLVDLIATFPFGTILSNPNIGIATQLAKLGKLPKMIKFLRAIRLLKLLRVYKLQQFISKLEVNCNIHHGISRLIKIVIMVMLVTHIVGCFWYLVGISGGDDIIDGGWMYRFDFQSKSTEAKYVASLYWAFSTLTTVGYGDISARTPLEQGYSMLMMLLGVSWYAYVVSSMSLIMSSFDAHNKAVRDKMIGVNEFTRAARLPPSLSKKVRSFFEFKLANSQRAFLITKQYDADELLDELSSGLRSDLLLFMERDLVQKIPFFKNKVPQFVADAITMFQPMVFQEDDFIVKEGTQADEMFFLIRGKAAVYYGEKEHTVINQGGYFGEIGCIMGGIRKAGIKALCTCELQALSRRNLNVLLREYPDVAEELKSVAKQRAKVVKSENKDGSVKIPRERRSTLESNVKTERKERPDENFGGGSSVSESIDQNEITGTENFTIKRSIVNDQTTEKSDEKLSQQLKNVFSKENDGGNMVSEKENTSALLERRLHKASPQPSQEHHKVQPSSLQIPFQNNSRDYHDQDQNRKSLDNQMNTIISRLEHKLEVQVQATVHSFLLDTISLCRNRDSPA